MAENSRVALPEAVIPPSIQALAPMTTTRLLALLALFTVIASSTTAEGATSARPSPPPPARRQSPPPPPAPAPAPRPSPAPVARAAAAAPATVKVSASVQPTGNYKSVTTDAPIAAVPIPPRYAASPKTINAPSQSRSAAQAPTKTAGPGAGHLGTQLLLPMVLVSGLSATQATGLAPSVQRFKARYGNVQMRHAPTASGWTWLFLWWALSDSDENRRLQDQNEQLRAQMQSLERDLRQDPDEWQQLQALAGSTPVNVAASSPQPQVELAAEVAVAPASLGTLPTTAAERLTSWDDTLLGRLGPVLPWLLLCCGLMVFVKLVKKGWKS